MPTYYTPGVYFENIDHAKGKIPAIRTDIPGFVGICEKGPLNNDEHEPVRLESWKQFQSVFGSFIPQSYLAYSVYGFFENGGDTCYVKRVADSKKAKKAGVILFDRSKEISELGQTAKANDEELSLTDGGTLKAEDYILMPDGDYYKVRDRDPPAGKKITISPELKKAYKKGTKIIKIVPIVMVSAINEGQWGNKIKVSLQEGSTHSTGTAKSPEQPTDRLSSIVEGVSGFKKGSLVRVLQNKNGTIIEKYHYVKSVDVQNKKIEWDDSLEEDFELQKPIYFTTIIKEFILTFSLGGDIKEVFENLSLNEGHPRYFAKEKGPRAVINGQSNLVAVEDMQSDDSIPDELRDSKKREISTFLREGADGISSVNVNDFTGASFDEKKGLRCYEDVEEVSMICIPDIMIQREKVLTRPREEQDTEKPDPCKVKEEEPGEKKAPPLEPPLEVELASGFTGDDILDVQIAMVDHCEKMKDRIAILDSPIDSDIASIQEWRLNFDSKYTALYFPWIRVNDPLRIDNQLTRMIPPSGYISGIFARNDLTRGVHKAPANEEILGAKDVDVRIESPEQDILNPRGINCLRVFPGKGIVVWGARTLSSDTDWRFVNVRRLFIMIEESVEAAVQWAVFEPNDSNLRTEIKVSVSSFLEELWRKGALAGSVPGEAFYVKCDETNNPQEVIDEGRLITDIGVAPSIPGEFIILRISKVRDSIKVIKES